MAVTFDAVGPSSSGFSSTESATSGTSSWTHTLNASANMLLAWLAVDNVGSSGTVTCKAGSNSMSAVGSPVQNGLGGYSYCFSLANPPTGSVTITFTWSFSSTPDFTTGGSFSFLGASGSLGTPVTVVSGTGTTITLTCTGVSATSMVAAFIGIGDPPVNPSTGTSRFQATGAGSSGNTNGNAEGATNTGSGNVSCIWSTLPSGDTNCGLAVEVLAGGATDSSGQAVFLRPALPGLDAPPIVGPPPLRRLIMGPPLKFDSGLTIGQFNQTLNASLSATTALNRADSTSILGTGLVNFVGKVNKADNTTVLGTGSLTSIGTLTKMSLIPLGAVLTFIGAMSRQTFAVLTGLLTSTGSLLFALSRTLATSLLTPTGTLNRQTSTPLSAVISFIGSFSIIEFINQTLTAALSFAGSLTKQTGVSLSGALTFIGSLVKQTAIALSGQLTFSGALAAAELVFQALSASLSFVSSLSRQTQLPFTGALSFVGSMSRAINAVLSGNLTFAGSLNKATSALISAALNFTGLISKQTQAPLNGQLSFAGSLSRATSALVSGLLTFIGSLTSTHNGQIAQALNATLSFVGAINRNTSATLSTGQLSFVGALSRTAQKTISAVLTFTTKFIKQTLSPLTATLAPVGTLTRQTSHTVTTAALSLIGSFIKQTSPIFTTATTKPTGSLAELPQKNFTGLLAITGVFNSKSITSHILGIAKLAFSTAFTFIHHGQVTNIVTWFASLSPSRWETALNQSRWSQALRPSQWTTKLGSSRWQPNVPITRAWRTGLQWYGGLIATVTQSALSLEYIEVPVVAILGGAVYNPTGDTLQFAFMPNPPGAAPSSGNWVNGVWSIAGTQYTAQCLVGPGGAQTLTTGTYDIWVKITDSPEVPVRKVGTLVID